MATARASRSLPGLVHEAELRWYDTERWPAWVDGLDRVLSADENWPEVGATVIWESGPAGRGRVTERVLAYEARRGQTVQVEDDSITGRQSVSFVPAGDGLEVQLRLEYRITKSSIVTPVVDFLFIRRVMSRSLAYTLERFEVELTHDGGRARGS
jgi:hypothetical protein